MASTVTQPLSINNAQDHIPCLRHRQCYSSWC